MLSAGRKYSVMLSSLIFGCGGDVAAAVNTSFYLPCPARPLSVLFCRLWLNLDSDELVFLAGGRKIKGDVSNFTLMSTGNQVLPRVYDKNLLFRCSRISELNLDVLCHA